ncbi:MAG: biosis protein MshJ [Herminiimonas sp.]|nr:biosis protein MshJ [Herminiimonas sp.]
MKQYWQQLVLKVDALTLRERAIIFAMLAVLLITLINTMLLDPQFAKQKQLSEQVKAEQEKINLIQTEIRQAINMHSDPDTGARERLKALRQQAGQMQAGLVDMQKGLVSPDKMTVLLEDILKRNGKLRLLSLKTLPASSLTGESPVEGNAVAAQSAGTVTSVMKNKVDAAPAKGAVYTHGVEIVVQGEYLEMMNYMAELERMPWQLFWGKAKLNVDDYPKATLALTLYTLSLDKKWLNL